MTYTELLKQGQGLRGLAQTLKKVLLWLKMLSDGVTEKSFPKEESTVEANLFVVLFQETATTTPTFSCHHPDQSKAINTELRASICKKITTCSRLRWW